MNLEDFNMFECCGITNNNKPYKVLEVDIPLGNLYVEYSLNITSMVEKTRLNKLDVWIEIDGEKKNFETVNFYLDDNVNNNLIVDPLPKKEELPNNIVVINGIVYDINLLLPWQLEYVLGMKKQQDDALEILRLEEEKNKVVDNSIYIKFNHQHLYKNNVVCKYDIPKKLAIYTHSDVVEGYVGLSKLYVDNKLNTSVEGCYIKFVNLN